MRTVHVIAGGTCALSAAILIGLVADESARPSPFAIPVLAVVFAVAALVWVLTRSQPRPPPDEFDAASDEALAVQRSGVAGDVTQVRGNYYRYEGPRIGPALAPPHIVFRDHEFGEGALWWPPQWPGRTFRSLVIPVANDPPPGVQAERAEHVCAYLTIELPDGSRPLDGVQARWTAKPQAGQRSKYQALDSTEIREVTMPPNGAPFRIDTILYLRDEEEIRPYTEAGPQSEIKADHFYVHVRVRGTNMDKTTRYRIERTPENPFDGFEVAPVALMRVPVEPPAYDEENPFSRARRLERDWRSKELSAALLVIRQELVVNHRRLGRVLERGSTQDFKGFPSAQWTKHEDRVRREAPGVCVLADQAYGLIVELRDAGLEDQAVKLLTDDDRELGREAMSLFERAIAEIDRGQP